ncbi:hypothetical protein H257_16305 [Aphanomyces astaci]|uniref:Uncharacterized protein n=1 Tax=Aphanomyces astaci TaxID=112090 RepID=W4FLA0_APHAT|nr:hypothetical protein H257_16305 [Aphanomyces astaci]ETV67579.1 hypothetical protein H257_16305 [Aphanomyces astaci]|eukprot:XP_009842983.1 hypothetical protein H257_16305 [Aphanomyces astaci]
MFEVSQDVVKGVGCHRDRWEIALMQLRTLSCRRTLSAVMSVEVVATEKPPELKRAT